MIGLSRLVVIIDLIEKHMGEKKKTKYLEQILHFSSLFTIFTILS